MSCELSQDASQAGGQEIAHLHGGQDICVTLLRLSMKGLKNAATVVSKLGPKKKLRPE